MKISEELAKIIVDNIHEVIPEEINFINADGLIIASTDPKRMHRLHTGALSVIQNRKQLSVPRGRERRVGEAGQERVWCMAQR